MSENTGKRARLSTKKWHEAKELDILNYLKNIIQNNLELEKPSASIFFDKMILELKWKNVSASQLKNKVRNLKNLYTKANDWPNQTGQGVDAGSVRDYILSICPHWDMLDDIYGGKTNIAPTYVFDSDIVDDLLDDNIIYDPVGTAEEIVGDDNCTLISQSSENATEPVVVNEETVQPLEKFKRFLPKTKKNSRTSSNSSSALSEAQMMRAKAIKAKNKIEAKWKEISSSRIKSRKV